MKVTTSYHFPIPKNLNVRCSNGADTFVVIFSYKAIGTYGANEPEI